MKARPVKYVAGATMRTADPGTRITPQRMAIGSDSYWISSANGVAVASITTPGAQDFRTGALSIVVYQDALPGHADGFALARSMTPDHAEEFAARLVDSAKAIRQHATAQAAEALRKAAGK